MIHRSDAEVIPIVASCGHRVEVMRKAGDDPYLRARIERDRNRPCGACRQEAAEAHTRAQKEASRLGKMGRTPKSRVKKGQEGLYLPAGARFCIVRQEDGTWSGTLDAADIVVSSRSAGLMGINNKLARKWLAASGAMVKGQVKD